MWKQKLAFVLCFVLLVSVMPMGTAFAAEAEPTDLMYEEYYDAWGARHTRYVDENGNAVTVAPPETFGVQDTVYLPSSFDARDAGLITPVRDQNPYGSCWSFAYCASAESSLIAQGYADTSINLSEAHLVWARGNSYYPGSSNPVELDGWISDEDTFDYGGNEHEATAVIAKGSGFALEADYPYKTSSSQMQYAKSDLYQSNYCLMDMTEYEDSEVTQIKQKIMEQGALAASMYYDDNYLRTTSSYAAYYQNVTDGTNHAITVIGWDDNFPASNFRTNPGGAGAWLIKNSWDTWWGDDGYVWISYYDTAISYFASVTAAPTGRYDAIAQYDGYACYNGTGYSGVKNLYAANVFTAPQATQVVGGSFYQGWAGYTAQISLYTGLTNASKPTSGTLRATKTVDCSHAGYRTAYFDQPYSVAANEKYAIVVKLSSPTSTSIYVSVEGRSSEDAVYGSSSGQSFLSSSGTTWSDVTSSKNNFPIKAFTKTAAPTLTGIAVQTPPQKTQYVIGQSFDPTGLTLLATYSNETQTVVTTGFTCAPTQFNTAGTQTVTVSYEGKTVSFTVQVLNPVLSVGNATGYQGKYVDMTVSATDNPGLTQISMEIQYDSAKLELQSVAPCGDGTASIVTASQVVWQGAATNGDLLTLHFRVLSDAAEGTTSVSVSNATPFSAVAGTLTILPRTPGDVNGDGNVDLKDCVMMRRALTDGWGVTLDPVFADVEGDDQLSLRDVVLVKRYVVGGWDVVLV